MRQVAALVLAAASALSSTPATSSTSSAPAETRSHYLTTVDTGVLARTATADATDALSQGLSEAMVVLDAGSPAAETGAVRLPDTHVHAEPDAVAKAVEAYGDAWRTAKGPHLVLVVGTTNYGQFAGGPHGAAWARMVEEVAAALPGIDVRGGLDAEQEYNTPLATRSWVEAYDASGTRPYVDFGSCTCPPAPSTPANGWSMEDVYAVAVGDGRAVVLPEIYATKGGNARAWGRVVAWAREHHPELPVRIAGALTELGACVGPPRRACPGIDNPPAQAWTQLSTALGLTADSGADLRFLSDISYLPTPARPHSSPVLREPLLIALAVLVVGGVSTTVGWRLRSGRRGSGRAKLRLPRL